ncbi:MAG: protoporphyrinogen oxidase, partial [Myxococcales bacterium]|nr:protoporphyrinogen oxidase [Myxococcales bacterium]
MTARGPKRIAVVGGGISGLSAAHRIVERDPGAEVVLFEGSARVGGLIYTERFSGYVIEHGPDAILTQKPWALDLAERLGLADQLVRTLPENAGAYVVHRGHLERIPDGFSLMAPTSLRALARTPLLSTRGKVRAALEWVLPSRPPAGDESLESFVVRRFGREIYDALAQPLVGGIYGADPSLLSLRATMPRFPDFERTHGSVVRGLRSQVSKDPSERA